MVTHPTAPTLAQQRLLDTLARFSRAALEQHPDCGGWVEAWPVIDRWGSSVPLGLVPNAGWRTFEALLRAGLVDEHPEHRSLVRPAGTGRGA